MGVGLLILGALLRILLLRALPYGLNQDEASAGYDAWAILRYGMDRNANRLPLLLEAWGSGQNALYSYLAMPFIALFGLNVAALRLPMALSGCLTLLVMWRLARRVRGRGFGLAALFFLALCPWHIMISRWALESNLLPSLLLAGIFFTLKASERDYYLIPAALCYGLSLYAYGTAFFFLPLFLIFALVWLRRELLARSFFPALALFILIALPIALCQLRNALGLPAMSFLGFTLPELTQTRQSATSILGGEGGLAALRENLLTLWRILTSGSDGLIFNSLPGFGIVGALGGLLALLGLGVAIYEHRRGEALMLAALGVGVLAAALINGNINRLNFLWLPLAYFSALGLYFILCKLRRLAWLPLLIVIIARCLFLSAYWNTLGCEGNPNYFPGLGEAIQYVERQEPESAFVSYYVNQPYIFVLFYTQTPPGEFADTVSYINPDGAFRWVRSFGCWRFGSAERAEGEYLILHRSEAAGRRILESFGEYVV